MNDLGPWTTKLSEAAHELDAARTRSAVHLAARRLMRVRAEVKRLEHKAALAGLRFSGAGGPPKHLVGLVYLET